MKKISKKEMELSARLQKFNLPEYQFNAIIKLYRKHKDEVIAFDHGIRFNEVNTGKKVRGYKFECSKDDKRKRGVYKITFDGDKFYIGRSKDIGKRIHEHERQIDQFLITHTYVPEHYLSKLFEYLKIDPFAYYFTVTVIEECYTVTELQQKEQKWLNKYKGSPNCLNKNFTANKPINEIDDTPEEYNERKNSMSAAVRGRGENKRLVFFPKNKSLSLPNRRETSYIKSTPQKKQSATEFYFEVPEINSDLGPTVFKLFYNDKYIIHKGKTLAGSIFLLQKGCGYFIAYDHSKMSKFEMDYYHKFYDYIQKHPGLDFRIEIIKTTSDAYDILVTEQLSLNAVTKDKNCLNNNLTGYIPTLNPKTNMHNWISPQEVERFQQFLVAL